jgi:SAM-dependent methyltransferase
LYSRTALWLIAREAGRFADGRVPALRLRMGEYLHECGNGGKSVMFTHSNCVLSLPGKDGHSLVREFYRAAADETREDIINPVQYTEEDVSFIPPIARVRSYGCGSPVADAGLAPGATVVDLGCGAGMECFLAAAKVGPAGRVIGVDMLTAMLDRANQAAGSVAENLGYANVEFCRALLEDLPLKDATADVVISNCVVNLCPHKRKAFCEIFRILKPEGRLVISDVASQDIIPLEIQYNEKLRGECLGGAFRVDRLFELLGDIGFRQATILKRFPYRRVREHQFHSITYSAIKPAPGTQKLVYRGPFAGVVTEDGELIRKGEVVEVSWQEGTELDEEVFLLDEHGNVRNIDQKMTCSCFQAPEQGVAVTATAAKYRTDCLACGEPLVYLEQERPEICHYCRQEKTANAICAAGHFVCDACHSRDALAVMRHLLLHAAEPDMVCLLKRVRSHFAVPVHGPEHHSLVPGIIVAAYRICGGQAGESEIDRALERGSTVAGGACAFFGVCGAATGVGIGLSVLMKATPYKANERQVLQRVTADVLAEIAAFKAPRCCQRDCWVALRKAAEVSERLLGVRLAADEPLICEQHQANDQCIGRTCPLWPVE